MYDTGTIYIGKITKIDEVSKNAEASFLSKMDGNCYKVKKQQGKSIYGKYIRPHSS
jgi:ribosomal protein L35AE/L33A